MSSGTPSGERATREEIEYRDLDLRVSSALAAVEASYTEAQRHPKRLEGGGRR